MSVSIRQHVPYAVAKKTRASSAFKRDAVRHTVNNTKKGYQSREARGRSWSDVELAILRVQFGRVPSADIAVVLGRTVASVNHRASCMGLKK